jgi:hypothetical protein
VGFGWQRRVRAAGVDQVPVGFENGSGPAPVASNVAVLDSSTITPTVTVKSGGNASDRIWDLRVGSAVLSNAVEVLK